MKAFACLVRQTPNAWIVSIGNARPMVLDSAGLTTADLVQEVIDYLDREQPTYGRCNHNIVLCPESRSTLFASSSIPASLKTRDRQQLKYHAESLLPIDAERMAADFVLTATDLRVMAIDCKEWEPIIAAFSARDLHFRWIAPAAVLAVEEATRSLRPSSPVIVWEDQGACDLWQLDSSGVVRWTHLADSPSDRLLAIRLFAAQTPEAEVWTAINCEAKTLELLSQLSTIELRSIQMEPQSVFASKAADRLSQSTFEAWFDLRDGVIAGDDRYRSLYGWMRIAAAAVVGFMLVFSAACFWKSLQTERQIAKIEQAHEELFKATFPGLRVPELLSMHIESEQKKLQGSTNGSGEIKKIIPPALEVLRATLTALQSSGSVPVQATRLDIRAGELDADFLFENRQDASKISDQFKAVGIETGPLGMNLDQGKIRSTFKGSLGSPPKTGTPTPLSGAQKTPCSPSPTVESGQIEMLRQVVKTRSLAWARETAFSVRR